MPRIESYTRVDPESLMDEALQSRPPIPADLVDISELLAEIADSEVTEPGWAWTRLPLWIAEIESTYDRIGDIPIVTLDLCSSVPVYAHRLRFLEFERDGERARGLMGEMFSPESLANLNHENPELKPVQLVMSRHDTARRLLEAAIQESLYEITSDEAAGDNASNPLYRQRLGDKLAAQHKAYTRSNEALRKPGIQINSIDHESTYLEYLAHLEIRSNSHAAQQARQRMSRTEFSESDIALARQKQAIGTELAAQYLDWQTNFIADRVVGHRRYRPARFLSMDKTDPRSIAVSALANMPESEVAHDGFSHAISSLFEPLQHIRGNIFDELPFPDNSLALITCFDAWPFHFQTDPQRHGPDQDFGPITEGVLHSLYRKLAYGGKMVIFPWSMNGESYATSKGGTTALTNIAANFGGSVDEQFNMKGIHRGTLNKYMSAADRETSDRMSPILASPNDYFFALVITKSKESSLNALRIKSHLGDLAITEQAQD